MGDAAAHWRAWGELLRLPNLPSAATNALAGASLGLLIADPPRTLATTADLGTDLPLIATAVAGIVGLYAIGLLLNDLFDLEIDRRERPRRPLPSGRIAPEAAAAVAAGLWPLSLWAFAPGAAPGAMVGLALFAAGATFVSIRGGRLGQARGPRLLMGALAGGALLAAVLECVGAERPPYALELALLLTGAILLYDRFHDRHPATVALPALCRVMAVVLAALAMGPLAPWGLEGAEGAETAFPGAGALVLALHALVIGGFVLAVSVVARGEVASAPGSLPQIATVASLGRRPALVACCGVLVLGPAALLGALPIGAGGTWLHWLLPLACWTFWIRVATAWKPTDPVPRLVGRWLGSVSLLDAVVLAVLGPLLGGIAVALHLLSGWLARRFAGS
jgi:4-hydroxybenzoate polyprenyltransferase